MVTGAEDHPAVVIRTTTEGAPRAGTVPRTHRQGALHPTPATLHPTPYTLHPTPYTLHPTPVGEPGAHTPQEPCQERIDRAPYTLHPTPYTLHPAPYTLHPTPYTLHPEPGAHPAQEPCQERIRGASGRPRSPHRAPSHRGEQRPCPKPETWP